MKLEISLDEKELIIIKKKSSETAGEMLVHKYSMVPELRGTDPQFDSLRDVALYEWYIRCGVIIDTTLDAIIGRGKK